MKSRKLKIGLFQKLFALACALCHMPLKPDDPRIEKLHMEVEKLGAVRSASKRLVIVLGDEIVLRQKLLLDLVEKSAQFLIPLPARVATLETLRPIDGRFEIERLA